MRWRAGLVAGILCVQGAAARAQGRELLQHTPFLDASDVFANLPSHQTVFEGQLSPNLVISQNLSNRLAELDPRFGGSAWGHAHALSFDPMVRLRMLQQFSEPVRTPSYMPKLTYQEFFYRARDTSAPSADLVAAQFTIGHHSNGQDGCTFLDQKFQNGDCVAQRVDRTAETAPVNVNDGSFSTNYVTIGARFRRTVLDTSNAARFDWTLGGDLELNPTRLFGDGGLPAELSYLYGPTRLSAIAGAATRAGPVCSRLEVLGTAKYIPGAPSTVPKVATAIRGACVFSESGGWGVVLGYFRGQDYYNLNFLQDVSTFRIGVTYEQDGFLRFKH
jgi:hypothetical protein